MDLHISKREERKIKNISFSGNNWILVRADVDLTLPLTAFSMAGLNLSNPKPDCVKPADVSKCCSRVMIIPETRRRWSSVGSGWLGTERERETEEQRSREAEYQSQCVDLQRYWGKNQRGAAELYVRGVGAEACVCVWGAFISSRPWLTVVQKHIKNPNINSNRWMKKS